MGGSGRPIGREGAIKGRGRSNEEHVKAGIYARPKRNEEDEIGQEPKWEKGKKEAKRRKKEERKFPCSEKGANLNVSSFQGIRGIISQMRSSASPVLNPAAMNKATSPTLAHYPTFPSHPAFLHKAPTFLGTYSFNIAISCITSSLWFTGQSVCIHTVSQWHQGSLASRGGPEIPY